MDETIGVKDQMMVRKSDIHVLNLSTGKHQPVPGAAQKDRVENLPYWSPDGKRIAFIRTKPGQMWHGAAFNGKPAYSKACGHLARKTSR